MWISFKEFIVRGTEDRHSGYLESEILNGVRNSYGNGFCESVWVNTVYKEKEPQTNDANSSTPNVQTHRTKVRPTHEQEANKDIKISTVRVKYTASRRKQETSGVRPVMPEVIT